ncbi:MAG: hypothetical protein LC747_00620, partial [Acidobacteria bacterium]|nr:hypothetical protein [Acidobacteriota bacterium]
ITVDAGYIIEIKFNLSMIDQEPAHQRSGDRVYISAISKQLNKADIVSILRGNKPWQKRHLQVLHKQHRQSAF